MQIHLRMSSTIFGYVPAFIFLLYCIALDAHKGEDAAFMNVAGTLYGCLFML